MSTSSLRRTTGGGAKPAATGKITPVSGKSMSTGKENPRPTSRVRASIQKPNIRPMARIDKSAVTAEEPPRGRRSTSAVPRGRSSSPSEFNRVLSDLRRNNPRVSSIGPPPMRKVVDSCKLNEKSGEKCSREKRVVRDAKKSGGVCGEVSGGCNLNARSGEKCGLDKRVLRDGKRSGGACDYLECGSQESERSVGVERKGGVLSSVSGKSSGLEKASLAELKDEDDGKLKIRVLSGSNEKRSSNGNFNENLSLELGARNKGSEEVKLRLSGVGAEVGLGLRESKVASKVSAVQRENGANKYPSKLHEKLAFLEGKVKRIASDIKRTKEMLDMNNPDASKMILSDIQEKISGIEKAMGSVVGHDGEAKTGSMKSGRNEDKEEEKVMVDSKSSAKGLNVEELEARLFPHHKLIRDRTLSKTTGGGLETHTLEAGESNGTMNVEEKTSCLDGNAIAAEFLASLNKETVAESSEVQEVDDAGISLAESSTMNVLNGKGNIDAFLMADEKLDEFDDQENLPAMEIDEEVEEVCSYQLNGIGGKSATGGWFVSEGESVLLAHDDGSCTFYDVANSEEKAEYKPPSGVSPNMWRDCWIIRAPGADGCSGKYVVAASAGNSVDSGFCSWDFYTKDVRAFHYEDETSHTARTALAPLSNNTMYRRNTLSTYMATENRQWWYKPCGPLIISTASSQKMLQIYDIRDGDQVMKWELQKPVLAMDYASPLQWRNRGKVVIAESDGVSLWDVSSLSSQALVSVSSSGRKISALHVNNTDAELGGGVRQRISSSEAEGNDGVFCTPDSINILDFRHPSGIGLKIPKVGVNVQSAFSRGDSIYTGCTNLKSAGKKHSSQIQQLSLRTQRLLSTYELPESNSHHHFTALTQVGGNSSLVMGVCGLGLFVFDSMKDDHAPLDFGSSQNAKEIIGPDDMYSPSFDYSGSRVLIISRDRPACWRYLL